jgi:hypothetical protein
MCPVQNVTYVPGRSIGIQDTVIGIPDTEENPEYRNIEMSDPFITDRHTTSLS